MTPPPPPPVILLLPFGLGRVACRRHNMQYISVDAGATSPQQFHGRVLVEVQGACILQYLILGLILPNNRWMVTHFFMCIAVQSHRKIPKVQSFQFSSFLSEKMCMFYSSSWIIFLNLRVTDQCQDRPSTLQHLSDCSKNVLFFYNFIGTASLRTLCLCLLKLKGIIKGPHG